MRLGLPSRPMLVSIAAPLLLLLPISDTCPASRSLTLDNDIDPRWEVNVVAQRVADELVATCGDFDGDGQPEFVCSSRPQGNPIIAGSVEAYEFTPDGWELVWQHPSRERCRLQSCWDGDLDADGRRDIAVQFFDAGGPRIEIWDFDERCLLSVSPLADRAAAAGPWDGDVVAGPCVDLNRDRALDLVISINAGWAKRPRSIVALDGRSGQPLWSTPIACQALNNVALLRAAADPAATRLLVGGWASGNRVQDGRFDDGHAWRIVLDGNGRVVEADSLGGTFADVRLVLDEHRMPRGAPVFFTLGGTGRSPWGRWGVYRIGSSGAIDRFAPQPGPARRCPVLAQVVPDPALEVVTFSGGERPLRIYSQDLREIRALRMPRLATLSAIDLFGGARDEFMAVTEDHVAHLLDCGLRPMATLATAIEPRDGWVIERDAGAGTARLFIAGYRGFAVASVALPEFPWVAAGGMTLAALAVLAGAWFGLSRRGPAIEVERGRLTVALGVLTAFGHGKPGMRIAHAASLLGSATAERRSRAEWRRSVRAALTALERSVPEALQSAWEALAPLGRGDLDWRSLQRAAGEVLSEVAQVGEAMQRDAPPPAEVVAALGARLRRLDDGLRELRGELRSRFRCDVEQVARTIVADLAGDAAAAGIELTLRSAAPTAGRPLMACIDPERLAREVIAELIQNAVRIQQGRGGGWIEVRCAAAGSLAVIEVEDRGPGVDPALGARIFERGVSTRPGGGFGLARAREVLREFGGGVRHRAAPGGGAIFRVQVPRLRPAAPAQPASQPRPDSPRRDNARPAPVRGCRPGVS